MFSFDNMDNSSEDPQLITETLSFDESDFSVLPVIIDGQTVSLSDFETDPLEPETLLSIPFTSISPVSLLLSSRDTPDIVSECKDKVFETEDLDGVSAAEKNNKCDEEEKSPTEPQVINVPVVVSEVDEPQCSLVEGQILQLEGGTIAYIYSQPQDGSQAVELENGTVAYITLTQPVSVVDSEEIKNRKPRSFMCPEDGCGRLYTSAHHLKVHERTHTGSRPYLCTVEGCKKAFSTDYSRKAHIRTHTGEKPYKCSENPNCTKSFKTSGDLQKHIRTHTGERPFVCPVEGCNRSFTTSNIRKVHVRTHTGERPYVCSEPMCDKAFASATNYKNHLRIHSGEKPYCCNVEGCNKKFTEYSSLYKHHMVHTQEKPYLCTVCGRSYRQVSTLTVHKRTSHGVIETEDGTEIVLGNVFTQKVLKSANLLAQNNKIKTVKTVTTSLLNDGNYVLDKGGSYQRISSEQIFIIEDMPAHEHLAALQSIEDTDDDELRHALDPLQEQ